MALQSNRLAMIALSVLEDRPLNSLQPALTDGIHLRWTSKREIGFPWAGYYLFRRKHVAQNHNQYRICLGKSFPINTRYPILSRYLWRFGKCRIIYKIISKYLKSLLRPTNYYIFAGGELSSDVALELAEPSPGGRRPSFDLAERNGTWFSPAGGETFWRAHLTLLFRDSGEIEIRAYFGEQLVISTRIKGEAGEISTASVEFPAITRLYLGAGPASLIELCVDPVGPGATENWELVPRAPAPFALPVSDPDYPCSPGPEDLTIARSVARSRVRYGRSADAIPDPLPLWNIGSSTLKANSSIVSGNSTSWRQDLTGGSLQVAGDSTSYTVAAVLSPEKLVLSRCYRGESRYDAPYTIFQDGFGQLHDVLMCLVAGGPSGVPISDRLLPTPIAEQGTLTLIHLSSLIRGVGVNWQSEYAGLALYVGRKASGLLSATRGGARVAGETARFDNSFLGLEIRIGNDSHAYTIIEVRNDSELKLDRPFEGESNRGLSFSLWEKEPYTIVSASASEMVIDRPYTGPADSGVAYAIRFRPQSLETGGAAPALAPQRAYDLVALASLHPAVAEAVGLAWVDDTVEHDTSYDYLIVAAHDTEIRTANKILSRIQDQQFSDLDGFIVFNVSLKAAAPPPPPKQVQVFALPGITYPGAEDSLIDSSNNAGLRWEVRATDSALTSNDPILFHIWRADLGHESPRESANDARRYRLLTSRPLLVPMLERSPRLTAPSPSNWPSLTMFKIDSSLPDGGTVIK